VADPKFWFRCRDTVLWKGFARVLGPLVCVEVKFRFVFPVDVLSFFRLSQGYFAVVGVMGVKELMNELKVWMVLPLDVASKRICKLALFWQLEPNDNELDSLPS
jgi:hypothetical protein